MGFVRCCWRLAFLVVWTTGFVLVYAALWPFTRRTELRRRRQRRRLLSAWSRGILRGFGIRVESHGAPPAPPFYLVANHISYMDVAAVLSCAPCVFVARGDVESWPVLGPIIKSLHMLFINRANRRDTVRVNNLIRHALEMGDSVAVFAESRISRGIDVEPFKSALIQPALTCGCPVHYATITYRSHPGAMPAWDAICWWKPVPMFVHLRHMLACRGVTCVIRWGEAPVDGEDRKTVAERLHRAVRAQFVPVE